MIVQTSERPAQFFLRVLATKLTYKRFKNKKKQN
jgi:hypothetical protein